MSQCYTVNFGAKMLFNKRPWTLIVTCFWKRKTKQKSVSRKSFFFFKKKCCPSIWAKTCSRHLPHNKENFLCWFSPSFVCSFLVGIYLCILYLCIINLRSRIGCCLCRWKQIASQMAELVERVHHDLKVMGSISAKVQF